VEAGRATSCASWRQNFAKEKPGQALQATALVHEAYLRLVGAHPKMPWDSRGHFFAAAAEAMRRILVEWARSNRRVKHGKSARRQELKEQLLIVEDRLDQILGRAAQAKHCA
jgi:hypothetical protein